MCGIFGYVGKESKPTSFILDGLRSLEYRGYDSWGIVVLSGREFKRERHVGKIGEAKTILPETTTGMGHTRWATHGGVTVKNSHPHFDCQKRFAVVHNGIIENERDLREKLIKKGHRLISETDSELIVHLLEEESKKNPELMFIDLVRRLVNKLQGAFAIGIMDRSRTGEIILARFGGPLVIGMTNDCKLFASDPTALLPFTKKVIYLQDREIAWITPDAVEIRSFDNHIKQSSVTFLDWDLEKAQKGGFEHFMLKEIMEQPHSLTDLMRGRVFGSGLVKLGGLESVKNQLRNVEFIRFLSCGSAWYAGLYGVEVISRLTSINCSAEVASEFRYTSRNWPDNSAAWFVSQSGETADVLGAVEKVMREKVLSLGLVNVVGSSVAHRTTAGVYLHAGPEIAVASTKAFTSQLTALLMIACWLAQNGSGNGEQVKKSKRIAGELVDLPKKAEEVLKMRRDIKNFSKKLLGMNQIYFFGRGIHYPIALEAALKLREVAYLDTIGMQTPELKHGAIAAMDHKRPGVVLAPSDSLIEKNRSSIQELRARKIPTYVITDRAGAEKLKDVADELLIIPKAEPLLQPILVSIAVQLLAYEMGVLLKRPIDKPRNLAKSVTVE